MWGPAIRAMVVVRPISGGSDAPEESTLTARVAAVISERPTCLSCIALKVDASKLDVVGAMERIEKTIQIVVERRQACTVCGGTFALVYWLRRE